MSSNTENKIPQDITKDHDKAQQKSLLKRVLEAREFSLVIILAVIVTALSLSTDTFASGPNITVMMQGMTVDMIIAVPMAISLIAGNIDFSVGSNLALSSLIASMAMNSGAPTLLGMLIGLVCGTLFGVLNGLIINKFQITPLVATLGTWMAYRGLALVISSGATIANLPSAFKNFGRGEFIGIPLPIVYMVIAVILGIFALKYLNFFNQAYYIGGNKASARLAGMDTDKFNYISYGLTGLMSAFAGLVLAARLGAVSQSAGSGLEFRNVVALLIGGVSMDGGEGTIIGAVLGVTLMQIVNNSLVLLRINPSWTQVITGSILVFSIAIDKASRRKKLAS